MAMPIVMSRNEIDESTLIEISKACNVSIDQIEDVFACTPFQTATIADSAIHPGASVFRFVLALSSSVDLDRFCKALQRVISLNCVLRTRFVNCRHGLVQVVIQESHHTERPSGDMQQYLRFDKAQPLGLGVPLVRTAITGHKLALTIHHGIMDHASLTPIFKDILTVYDGGVPEKRAEFKKFVAHCLGIDESMATTFWGSRFKGAPAIFPRVEQGYIPLATHTIARRLALSQIGSKVPLVHMPSFIEVAWALTASTYTGNESVAFGMILSGRTHPTCSAAETTLGPTIAVLPVQVNLQRNITVEEALRNRSAARRQLQTHPALQYGLSRIRTVSEAARNVSGFQTLLNIRPRWYDPNESSIISYDSMDEPHGAFALSLSCDLEDTGLLIEASSDPTVVCESQLNRVIHQFEHYLQSLMDASPQTKLERLPRLNPHDLSEIVTWNSTVKPQTVDKCLHELLKDHIRKQPDAMAVDACDGSVTYHELDQLSDRLAHELRRRGVSTESPVAFIFGKSLWTVVSVLSIMKAGGACVPIEPSDPPARKAAIISTAGAKTVLTSSAEYVNSIDFAPEALAVSAASVSSLPDIPGVTANKDGDRGSGGNLAYVMFTSGTTGAPKGVMLEHRSLASSLTHFASLWPPGCRMLQFASHVWDLSIAESFGALVSGGCLCIPSEEARESSLATYILSKKISCAIMTPTLIRTLSFDDVSSLQTLTSAGEAVSPGAAKTWGNSLRLINAWGPCEGSLFCTAAQLTSNSPYPQTIGTPINCNLWIVNPKDLNELVPIGAIGEIVIDGPGVARGYLKDDVKTKTSFIKPPTWAPFREEKTRQLYRSGDLAKYNADGSICFIGRQDNQVKIRGQRFELGELESVLAACDEVRDIFTTTKIYNGRTELVAVVCLADPVLPKEATLQEFSDVYMAAVTRRLRTIRDYAQSRLPSYMIPTIWLAVEQMPRSASAKLDRAAIVQWLKSRDLSSARATLDAAMTVALTPPRTAEEKLLHSVWTSVLHVPDGNIGCESYFVQLGGDSILAMQVVSQCLKRGLVIRMAALLKNITLAKVAESSTSAESMVDQSTTSSKSLSSAQDDGAIEQTAAILSYVETRVPQLTQLNQHFTIDKIDCIVPATDGQASMVAVGELGGRGYYIDFTLECKADLNNAQLQRACEQVIRHHSILRSVFVRYGPNLYQTVLKGLPPDMVTEEGGDFAQRVTFREGVTLARFHLFSNDHRHCQRLCLQIHHALYDAISLGLIFRDLDAAYTGRPLSDGPQFHSWISYNESLDGNAPREFWKAVLHGASMPYLVPPVMGAIRCHPLDEQKRIRIPLQNIETSFGTPSSAIKAAWALLISHTLGTDDVVFGEVSANRYLPLLGIHEVKGPCVNMVPVRARLNPAMTLASLVAQIQDLSTTGMQYHHLGTISIIKDCTEWPHWTRFSTAVVYQNHDSLDDTIRIGDSDCALSVQGKLGDSTDIHIIATPSSEELEVEFRFSALTFPSQQIDWIVQTFAKILDLFPSSLEQSLDAIETTLDRALGSYTLPPALPPKPFLNGHTLSPSVKAQEVVSQAWEELKLLPGDHDEDCSMWDCGADVVTTLLLAEIYRASGYDISPEDIVNNPKRLAQAYLVDSKQPKIGTDTSINGVPPEDREVDSSDNVVLDKLAEEMGRS